MITSSFPNVVTLDRARADAAESRYLFEDEYRLLVILLLAKADGWKLAPDAQHEMDRLLMNTRH